VKSRSFVEQVSDGLSAEPFSEVEVVVPDLKRELRRAGADDNAAELLIGTGRARFDRNGGAEVIAARGWLPAGAALREAVDFAKLQVSAERNSSEDAAADEQVGLIAPYRPWRGR
jgi:hypothetical protein